jgi:hypothetical protein
MFFLSAGLQVNAGGTGTAASRVQVPAMLLIIKYPAAEERGITRHRKPSYRPDLPPDSRSGLDQEAPRSVVWKQDEPEDRRYDRTLDLGQDAWDVYLLYGPETRWDGSDPPAPAYWMNQLGGANGPNLDSQTFADHARALLRQPAQ